MDLDTARRIYDGDRTHPDWLAAYKVVQWDTIWRADPQTLNAELADVEPDDRDVEVSGRYGCDETGAYYVEANSGPGWTPYSGATNVPRPGSP